MTESSLIADARRTLLSARVLASCALFTALLFWVIPAMFPDRPRWAYAAVVIIGGISLPWGFAERMKVLSEEMAKKVEDADHGRVVVTGEVKVPEEPAEGAIEEEAGPEEVEVGEEKIIVPDDLSGLDDSPAVADPDRLGDIPGFGPVFREEEIRDVQQDDE